MGIIADNGDKYLPHYSPHQLFYIIAAVPEITTSWGVTTWFDQWLEFSLFKCKFTQISCLEFWIGNWIHPSEVKLSHVWHFATPWTVAYQAPLFMEFSRQEYWSGLPFPSPGGLPNQGSNPGLLHCRRTLYRLSHQGSPIHPRKGEEYCKIHGERIATLTTQSHGKADILSKQTTWRQWRILKNVN